MSHTPNISSFTLIVAFLCVALAGLAFIPLLPVKLSPSRTLPSLHVYFSMPNNSSRVVEMEATSKLEAMLARIKGINSISSTSYNGSGRISLSLDKHTNIDAARFEASTIIRQTWPLLPQGVSYPYLQMSRSDSKANRPFMTYTLNAAASPIFIQRFAEEHIKTRLSQIPGIYLISVQGATPMEWRLEYNNRQLQELGVTVSDIRRAISQYYTKSFLGTGDMQMADGGEQWIRLALIPKVKEDVFDPSQISLTASSGKVLRLDQLLKVQRAEERPQSYYRINGLNSIYLSITAEETANQLEVSKKIRKTMDEIIETLPAGYEVHSSYDATVFIQEELDKIYTRTGLTILILLLFVLLITRSLKYLLLIVISLSVNIAIAVIFYYLCGLEMQLYSLAGITISLSLVIDNTIVMTDHMLRRRNKLAFLSILAATLTTIGALVIIFFLNEKIRLNLQDFAAVVIINLAISLSIALFLVPALMDKLHLEKKKKKHRPATRIDNRFVARMKKLSTGAGRKASILRGFFMPRRFTVYFCHYYEKQILFLSRKKVWVCILLVLLFGLPVFLLPEKIEKDTKGAAFYNKIVTSEFYKEKVKPNMDKVLGGTLRLFVQKVYAGSYFTRNEEKTLYITATLPNGAVLEQMNALIQRMESYLSGFNEIKQFQTNIANAQQASIYVTFTKKSEKTGFPYMLKSKIISKALQLGGGSWMVTGLEDQGFNNNVSENAGSYHVEMYGYNYDELYYWAEKFKERLLTFRRIKEVLINSEYSYYKSDYREFYFNLNKARLAQENLRPYDLFASLSPIFGKDEYCGSILVDKEQEGLKLSSRESSEYDIWNMQFLPGRIGTKQYKLSELATIEKGQMPQNICKINQQYRLCLQYEYIGASSQGRKILERELATFNKLLPMGYTAEAPYFDLYWSSKDNKQYLLLVLIIVIIFFTTSILFNSLRQPLSVIFVIPISYIGVFLTFYWFKLNFDQGGFASFVLLCGITVNASIYILNEFNQIRQRKPRMSPLKAYVKAWNSKIIPIFLTVVSTILGFVPFMLGENKEAFWFPLAAGTIGGLCMSVIGIFFYLPLYSLKKKELTPASSDNNVGSIPVAVADETLRSDSPADNPGA